MFALYTSLNFIFKTCKPLPWVPEDIFFLSILKARGEAASTKREAPREKSNLWSQELRVSFLCNFRIIYLTVKPSPEPYQTVSMVYFILGILRTDLWSQGSKPVVREENIAFHNDVAELKNLARSHTKHIMTEMRVLASALLKQLNITVLPNFYFLLSFA